MTGLRVVLGHESAEIGPRTAIEGRLAHVRGTWRPNSPLKKRPRGSRDQSVDTMTRPGMREERANDALAEARDPLVGDS